MAQVIKAVFFVGPLLFAFGFLWPLTSQVIGVLGIPLPGDLSPFWAGFILAAIWGSYAQWRGTWLPRR